MTVQQLLSENDKIVVETLRGESLTVGQLVEILGVTATAVRQRLNRLMAQGLVERSQLAEGRGRPSHHYCLTEDGRKSSGNNLDDLAVVLWAEVQEIEDKTTRDQVIAGVVRRLTKKYQALVDGGTPDERMASITRLFADRQIPITFETIDGLPVINVSGCPYPDLASSDRHICEMETDLLTQIIGAPVDLCQCQQDGDKCCSFQTTEVGLENRKAK